MSIAPMMPSELSDQYPGIGGFFILNGSSGGSGGTDEDPTLLYSGGGTSSTTSFTDVIGDDFDVFLTPPPGRTFATVTWSVSNTYGAQQRSFPAGGFTNYQTDMSWYEDDTIFSAFWGENPGNRTITATVTYVGGGSGSDSISGSVVKPSGNIVATVNGTPGIGSISGVPVLTTSTGYSSGVAGIDWEASVDPSSAGFPGKYGVIQTANPFTAQRKYTWFGTVYTEELGVLEIDDVISKPRPLLDDNNTATKFLYPGDDGAGGLRDFDPTKSVAYNSYTANDTPYVVLDSGYPNYTYNASF